MKYWYLSLNSSFKTSFWTLLVTLIIEILTSFLFFINLMEIPLGILLGGLVGSACYLIQGFIDKKALRRRSTGITIAFLIIKFLLILGLIVGDAFLYYKLGIKLFNLFALVGGYLIPVVILTIITLRYKETNG